MPAIISWDLTLINRRRMTMTGIKKSKGPRRVGRGPFDFGSENQALVKFRAPKPGIIDFASLIWMKPPLAISSVKSIE